MFGLWLWRYHSQRGHCWSQAACNQGIATGRAAEGVDLSMQAQTAASLSRQMVHTLFGCHLIRYKSAIIDSGYFYWIVHCLPGEHRWVWCYAMRIFQGRVIGKASEAASC